MYRLDLERLVEDCGGPTFVASVLGKSRTQPYRWIRAGRIWSDHLVALIDIYEELNEGPFDIARYRNRNGGGNDDD